MYKIIYSCLYYYVLLISSIFLPEALKGLTGLVMVIKATSAVGVSGGGGRGGGRGGGSGVARCVGIVG